MVSGSGKTRKFRGNMCGKEKDGVSGWGCYGGIYK